MKQYRLRDLPRKSWPSHIWMYYRWHILGAALAALTLAGMLRPLWAGRVDLSILWLGESHDLETDAALEARLAELPLDIDGDGRTRCLVHYLRFTGEEDRLTDRQMELVTLIGTGEFNVYLASPEAKSWLESHGILGSWSDFTGQGEDAAPFSVPCGDLPVFQGEAFAPMAGMYLVIAPPPAKEERQALYRRQMEALQAFFTWNGVTCHAGPDL